MSMIPDEVRGALVSYQGRSAVSVPNAFDGPFIQMLAQPCECVGNDSAGRETGRPPPEMASGWNEASILHQHRDSAGDLQIAITLLGAAALAGGRAQVRAQFQEHLPPPYPYQQLFGACWLPGEVGVDRLDLLPPLALAQILKCKLGEPLDVVDCGGGITHRRPPGGA